MEMLRRKKAFGLAALAALMLAACGASDDPQPSDKSQTSAVMPSEPNAAPPLPDNPPNRAETAVKVVVLGDSLSAGYRLAQSDALPEQIEERLMARGLDVDVINAGVSGDTTAGGLARFDWSVTSEKPDFVVIALGANDFLQNVPPVRVRANLVAIIKAANDAGIKPILAGLQNRSGAGSRGADYAAIYKELSDDFGLPLYPALMRGVLDNPRLLQADGLHPTAQGVDKMADGLSDFLAPILVPN